MSMRSFLHKSFLLAATSLAGASVPGSATAHDIAPMAANENAPSSPAGKFRADQDRLNAYLKEEKNPFTDRLIILDPDVFDHHVGMGLSSIGAVTKMLRDGGYRDPDPLLVRGIVRNLLDPMVSPGGAPILSAAARTFHVPEKRLCITLALADNALLADAPTLPAGMTRQEFIRYGNQHEFQHALDPVTDFSLTEPYMWLLNKVRFEHLPWEHFPPEGGFPGLAGAYAMIHRAEALADLAMAGAAVRDGKPLSFIDAYSDWRLSLAHGDPLHATTLELRELKKRIEDMGRDVFAAMSEKERQDIYADISGSTGISTPLAVQAFVLRALGSEGQKEEISKLAEENAEIRNGVHAYVMWKHLETMPWTAPDAARPAAQPPPEWDAEKILRQETLARHRVIMPATTLKTYAALRDGLRERAEKDPANEELYAEQGARLRTAFLSAARGFKVVLDAKSGGARIDRPSPPPPKP